MEHDTQPAEASKRAFRNDIQALRGVAVLLVVLYHASVPGLSAGYLGVDVFFVISGFLITTLIKNDILRGNFSFTQFYYRRAKRLLPPAYVVIALTVLAAPFFVSDLELAELKMQVVGALTFTANIVLWNQSGYFDGAAETKALLHFWSLAIEEQYYLLMPALLFFIPRRAWLPAVALLLLGSLLACLMVAAVDRSAAFYLLPTRAWELALGSLGALLPSVVQRRRLSWARIPAVFVLIWIPLQPTGLQHPGVDALLVCLATLAIILGHDNSRWESSTPVRALAWIGNFSYSLYLVHWPVLVFTRSAYLNEAPAEALCFSVILSFILSWVLYHVVEEPFRRGFRNHRRRLVTGLASASLVLAASPIIVTAATSSPRDFAEIRRVNYGIARPCALGERFPFEGEVSSECQTKPDAKVLVWGDSYAMAWTTALVEPLEDLGVEQATVSACDPLLNMARFPIIPDETYDREYARECIETHRAILEYVQQSVDLEYVVLAARFQTILSSNNMMMVKSGSKFDEMQTSIELAAEGLANMAEAVRASGKKVVVLAPPPADGSQIGDCLERAAKGKITFGKKYGCELPRAGVQSYRAETNAMLALMSEQADTPVIDAYDFLCGNSLCRTSIGDVLLYRDSGHLSVEGARLIGRESDIASDILSRAR